MSDLETCGAPVLVVAGIHGETSLGWQAASAWLNEDAEHMVHVTVRDERAVRFISKQVSRPRRSSTKEAFRIAK